MKRKETNFYFYYANRTQYLLAIIQFFCFLLLITNLVENKLEEF